MQMFTDRRGGNVSACRSAYLPKLCEFLDDALLGPRAVSLEATAIAVQLPPDKALSIGVIVNELGTNAIKCAFEEGQPGQVHVDLNREQDRFVLTVRDDGRGYSPSAETGLGTRLVTTFVVQLGGSAIWGRAQSGGCATAHDVLGGQSAGVRLAHRCGVRAGA